MNFVLCVNKQYPMASHPYGAPDYFRPVGMRPTLRAPVPPNFAGGDFGVATEASPVVPYNSDGHAVHFNKGPEFKRPLLVHVDSARRDENIYPNPWSFRLAFHKPLLGVLSIELLDIIYPNVLPSLTEPENRYTLLLNGLLSSAPDSDGVYKFTPQRQNIGIYKTMNEHNAIDPTTSSATRTYQFADCALAKLRYDPGAANQFWERNDFHKIHYFHPKEEKINFLDLTLADRNGQPYNMDPDENWSATLEVVCKQ